MRSLAFAVVVVVGLVAPGLASAQTTDDDEDVQSAPPPKPDKKKKGGGGKAKAGVKVKAGADVKAAGGDEPKDDGGGASFEAGGELGASGEVGGEDSASGDFSSSGTGEEENPGAPRLGDDDAGPVAVATRPMPEHRGPYPIQYVLRPLVLPERMTEVTLDLPNKFNKYMQSFVLGAHHGATDQLELGIRYNIGTFTEGGDGVDNEFYGGKAVALDVEYAIFTWLAAQASIPMLFDPFAIAGTLGAPMKFELFDKLSIELGRDIFTFKISRFIPSADNAALNEALTVADETMTDVPAAIINAQAAFTYQHKDNTAIQARIGQSTTVDSSDTTERNPLLFDLGLYYSTSNRIDFGGRLGWSDINDASENFGVWLFAAARF